MRSLTCMNLHMTLTSLNRSPHSLTCSYVQSSNCRNIQVFDVNDKQWYVCVGLNLCVLPAKAANGFCLSLRNFVCPSVVTRVDQVLLITNWKSRVAPNSMTLNDLERENSGFYGFFGDCEIAWIPQFSAKLLNRKVLIVLDCTKETK